MKKYILGILVAFTIPFMLAYAATPSLMVSGNGDNNNVTVSVTGGEPYAPVVLFYNPTTAGTVQTLTLGTTDQNGYWTGVVNSNTTGVPSNTSVYVQVGGYQSLPVTWSLTGSSSGNTGAISFNVNSPVIGVGQNGIVMLSGGNGTYFVSSNSNANSVSPSIVGNMLTLYGSTAGQSSIVVCSTGGGCGTIMATVGGSGSILGSPTVSQTSLNVNQGSQGVVTLSGGTGPYMVSVPAGSGVSTTLVGNTLYVNGSTVGTNTLQVCSANNGGCTPLTVYVQAQGSTNTGSSGSGQLSFMLPINVGQSVQLMLNGGSGSYYLQSPMSSPALASISGNTLTLNGSAIGSGMVTICSTGGSSCLPIAITVNQALTGTGGGYFFTSDLYTGLTSQDVMELQNRLAGEGYFNATATGYFGPITLEAVQKYQAAHGISTTGYVGPLTRAALNQ